MPIAGIYGPEDFGNPARRHPTSELRTRVSPAEHARALPMPSLQWTRKSNAQPHIFTSGSRM